MTDELIYYTIEACKYENGVYDHWVNKYRAHSYINGWKGNWRKSKEEAVKDGENHLRVIRQLERQN